MKWLYRHFLIGRESIIKVRQNHSKIIITTKGEFVYLFKNKDKVISHFNMFGELKNRLYKTNLKKFNWNGKISEAWYGDDGAITGYSNYPFLV